MNEIVETMPEETKKKKWIKEQGDENGTTRLEVRELDEGFLICITKDYKDEKGDWQYETKEYARMENPLFPEEKGNNVFELMDDLFRETIY